MQLIDRVRTKDRRLAAPPVGYPLSSETGTTAVSNLTDGDTQAGTLAWYYDNAQPDILFTFMDLSVEAEALGCEVCFHDDASPDVQTHPVHDESDLQSLPVPDVAQDGRFSVFARAIERTVTRTGTLLSDMRGVDNFIPSTGCDVPPGAPFRNVRAFIDAVRNGR